MVSNIKDLIYTIENLYVFHSVKILQKLCKNMDGIKNGNEKKKKKN